ncbi:MAG: UDP-N-acetylglucosamine 1-carboxyvinyltransferase [Rickettsiales bacterium]|jgi:UDP-N-acetylglucosamine 1-carboxyvinyltransferase|nr:UDP-N-acetylglucosamine 1-carboxyvinyltransferase [Rickettsiales bacterium]
MQVFRIRGGRPLNGKVKIAGAKNSVLELMPAALLTAEPVTLKNVPDLADIATLKELLEGLGVKLTWDKPNHTLHIDAREIASVKAPYEVVSKMRASIYVLGALLGRKGEAKVASPGGCVIGSRPINVHLDAFEALGAKISHKHGYIVATAPGARLRGGTVNGLVKMQDDVPITTHGGNVNTIEAAVLAQGHTTIRYASQEPEVDDLMNMLNAMGAKISRARDGDVNTIEIDGVESLHGVEYSVMPDRLEAATYAISAVMTRGRIEIDGADVSKMQAVLDKLREAGAKIEPTATGFIADGRDTDLRAVDIDVEQYPGFPTDVQSQFMALMTIAKGASTLHETLFENRLMYVPELGRMCADIEILDAKTARFRGVESLCAADVSASDLRSGAALAIAGLAASGETVLHDVHHVYRGYQDFVKNLRSLGADIEVEEI